MDLIGPGSMEPHFTDAWGAPVQNLPVEGEWVFGSGAGFPGIALAACYQVLRSHLSKADTSRPFFFKNK